MLPLPTIGTTYYTLDCTSFNLRLTSWVKVPPHAKPSVVSDESVPPLELVIAILVDSATVPTSSRIVE